MGDLGRTVEEFGGDYVALGRADVGELTREIDAWREAGGTHVSVVTMGRGPGLVGGHMESWPRSQARSACGDPRQRSAWRVGRGHPTELCVITE